MQQREANVGIEPLAHHLGRKRAYQLMAEAERLPADQCLALGLANRVVPEAALIAEAKAWARNLAERAPLALRYAKEALNKVFADELGQTMTHEAELQWLALQSRDAAEGKAAFLERRTPHFEGC